MLYSGVCALERLTGIDAFSGAKYTRADVKGRVFKKLQTYAAGTAVYAYSPGGNEVNTLLEDKELPLIAKVAVVGALMLFAIVVVMVSNLLAGIVGAAILVSLFGIAFTPFLTVFPAAFTYFVFWDRVGMLLMNFKTFRGLGAPAFWGWFFGVALVMPAAYLLSRYGVVLWGAFIGIHPIVIAQTAPQSGSAVLSHPMTIAVAGGLPGVLAAILTRNLKIKADRHELDLAIKEALAKA